MISIRNFEISDTGALWSIFYNTVRMVNIQDYSLAQVQAWASDSIDPAIWQSMLIQNDPFVALMNNTIVGYADLQQDGLIDHFFVHHAFQKQGVGNALMQHIIDAANERDLVSLHANVSKTAKPFFERFGFVVIKEQTVELRNELFTNFLMQNSQLTKT